MERFFEKKPLNILASCVFFLFNAGAGLLFLYKEKDLSLPQDGTFQILLVFLFLIVLSFINFFIDNKSFKMILVLFESFFLLILGPAFGSYIQFELLMILAFLSLLFSSLKTPFILCGIVFSFLILFDQKSTIVWGVQTESVDTFYLVFSFSIIVIYSFFWFVLRRYSDQLEKERKKNGLLRTSVAKLTSSNLKFQQYASIIEEVSLKKERVRISREIHDTVGYTMTSLNMMLEACFGLIETAPLRLESLLCKASSLVQNGHDEIRHALKELRTQEIEPLRGIPSYKRLIDIFRESTGVQVLVEWGNFPWSPGGEIDSVIYRFLQEGLSNALSHGAADKITIHFRKESSFVFVSLSDNGGGKSDKKGSGLGLKGMEERISALGGSFIAKNVSDGFIINAKIPLRKEGKESLDEEN